MVFTDSHAHLSSVAERMGAEAFEAMLAEYAAAAAPGAAEGGAALKCAAPLLVDVGTEPGDLAGRIELLRPRERSSALRLTAGVWPSAESLADPGASVAALEAAIDAAREAGVRVAAIGEGGLDYHHMNASPEAQAELFESQLELAARLGLPMIVHSREAFADTLAILARARPTGAAVKDSPVVIHCFGYGPAEASAFLEAGCFVSFAGNLTYKGAEGLREACAIIPADRLLLETDSPYMNPMPRRGRPSSPIDVARSYEAAAALRGASVEDLARTVSHNARTLFGEKMDHMEVPKFFASES